MSRNHYMVVLDTDKIQSYIFATNKLKEIRGASALLDCLNLTSIPGRIRNEFKNNNLRDLGNESYEIDKSKHSVDCKVISFGGGSVRLLLKKELKSKGDDFIDKIQNLYWKDTNGGATITGIGILQRDGESETSLLRRAEVALRKKKQNRSDVRQLLSNPYFKMCDSSGLAPASQNANAIFPDDQSLISSATFSKLKYVQARRGYFSSFAEFIKNTHDIDGVVKKYLQETDEMEKSKYLPESLATIGDRAKPSGYISLIFADGNRMGYRLQKHFSGFQDISDFSEQMKKAINHALYSTLYDVLEIKNEQNVFPFEVFLVGGDDVLLALPAQYAFPVALRFACRFNEKTIYRKRTGDDAHVSLGVGIIIAHANHPVHHLIQLAEELVRTAKIKSQTIFAETSEEVNCFNFLINKGASIKTYDEIEEQDLSYFDADFEGAAKMKLHQRPFTHEKLNETLSIIADLKDAGMPRSKLAQFYRALYNGWGQGTLDSLRIASRLSNEVKEVLFSQFSGQNVFPWYNKGGSEYETPLVDWIELFDFVDTGIVKRWMHNSRGTANGDL